MEDTPQMPVAYIHRLAELMAEEGLDADGVLREAGINPNLLRRPDSLLTLRQTLSITSHYMGLSSQPVPALQFGQRLDLFTHGLLGHVYSWRGNFRQLIESIVAYMRVRLPMLDMAISEGPDHFGIRMAVKAGNPAAQAFLLQTALGTFHTLCSGLTSNMAIHCRPDLFADVAAARHLLKTELNTDHDTTELRFYGRAPAEEDLPTGPARTPAPADPFEEPGFLVQLRNVLFSHLRGEDSAEAIASAMGMSVRTLRRRLAECGINFNKVRLDVRMQVALRYLTTTSISIERIAGYVGYSDQAAFTRAFREWSQGQTPAAVRQQRARTLMPGQANTGPASVDASRPPSDH